jgi:hypothetical protein
VRQPLIWLGRADPCDTVAKMRQDDPKRAALTTIVLQWNEALGTISSYTMREIVNVAVNRPDFYNAFLTVAAAGRASNLLSNERLGRWFKANENKNLWRFQYRTYRVQRWISTLALTNVDSGTMNGAIQKTTG